MKMGMFDYFECTVTCPVCGNPLKEFQTKDFERLLDVYEPGDVVNDRSLKKIRVYTTCVHFREFEGIEHDIALVQNHGLRVEYIIPINRGQIVQDQNRWVRKVEHMDWGAARFLEHGKYTEQDIKDEIDSFNKKLEEDCRVTGIEVANHE